ncbi:MAG: flavodoxin family protein [Anaerolineae bacterium]|nr:flavodoxin family protein [Anaerolineae bacterium]
MTQIIVLNGGPRKHGNTFRIAQWVAEGAAGAGADIDVIHLGDYHIEHCRGCESCGHLGHCVIQDDHEDICRRLDQAQGLIVCSPVFGGWYSAILKTFYDRLTCTLGFTGRFDHLHIVGITTAKYDFRLKNAKEITTLNSSWSSSGRTTGYIHKSVLDTKQSCIVTLTPENSPKLYRSAHRMGEKLVADIAANRPGTLPLPVRLLFKHLVLPGIGHILINHRKQAEFLYQALVDHGIITETLLKKHTRRMARIESDGVHKTTERIKFCR